MQNLHNTYHELSQNLRQLVRMGSISTSIFPKIAIGQMFHFGTHECRVIPSNSMGLENRYKVLSISVSSILEHMFISPGAPVQFLHRCLLHVICSAYYQQNHYIVHFLHLNPFPPKLTYSLLLFSKK